MRHAGAAEAVRLRESANCVIINQRSEDEQRRRDHKKSLRRAAKYKLSLLRSPRPHARAAIPSPSSSLRCPLSIIGALVSRKFGEMRARGACTRVRSHSKSCMHLNFVLRDSNASNVWLRDLGRCCKSCTRRNRPYRRARGVAVGFDVRNV